MTWLRHLDNSLLSHRCQYSYSEIHVGFVVDRYTLGHVFFFSQVLLFSLSVSFHQCFIVLYSAITHAE